MRKWLVLFMTSTVFLASCSFARLVLDDLRCYDTARRLDGVFQAARRVDGEVRLGVGVVEGGGVRLAIPNGVVLGMPVDGVVRFRGGVVQGDDGAWLCASPGTGSGWWVSPGGGVEGHSEVADWFLRGLRE